MKAVKNTTDLPAQKTKTEVQSKQNFKTLSPRKSTAP
jgi:hypothetical protein